LKEKLKDNTFKSKREEISFDSEYYQLKCATLEKKLKELTTKFSKELMKYKSTFIYVDNLDYLKHNDNFEENDVSINNVNYYIF